MKYLKYLTVIILLFNLSFSQCGPDSLATIDVCRLETNHGDMTFKFFEDAAPLTSEKFKGLVEEGFYDSLSFYRVVKGHVIQAGDSGENEIPTVAAEFNEYPHIVGTVGLAREEDPNSGNTEFYICLAPRPHLDGKYTVFGQLIDGYDILEKIGNVKVVEQFVGEKQNIAFHTPKEPVLIIKTSLEKIHYFVE